MTLEDFIEMFMFMIIFGPVNSDSDLVRRMGSLTLSAGLASIFATRQLTTAAEGLSILEQYVASLVQEPTETPPPTINLSTPSPPRRIQTPHATRVFIPNLALLAEALDSDSSDDLFDIIETSDSSESTFSPHTSDTEGVAP